MTTSTTTGTSTYTPRPPAGARSSGRTGAARLRAALLGLLVVAALGFVIVRGLGNATLFFFNVDEAVAQKDDLGERRFRLQGTVVAETVERGAEGATFEVMFDGVAANVRHQGDLPQLFQPNIPVVLEGRWQGDRFESDRMLVKHDEVYTAENPDRTKDYPEGAKP